MATTNGYWKLYGYSWGRLLQWLDPYLEKGTLYLPVPTGNQKQLSLTLQGVKEESVKELAGLRFFLRGLLWREGVLSICCYPQTNLEVHKIQAITGKQLTMVYCKLFESNRLTSSDVASIESFLPKWSEACFGELWPSKWSFGSKEIWTPLHIAHRALTEGPDSKLENNIDRIVERCSQGLYSEVDVWFIGNKWFLGHDKPEREINFYYLCSPYLFLHAKHVESFHEMQRLSDSLGLNLRVFYHTEEHYALTTRGETIIYPGLPEQDGWLYMMPERTSLTLQSSGAICSDFA